MLVLTFLNSVFSTKQIGDAYETSKNTNSGSKNTGNKNIDSRKSRDKIKTEDLTLCWIQEGLSILGFVSVLTLVVKLVRQKIAQRRLRRKIQKKKL